MDLSQQREKLVSEFKEKKRQYLLVGLVFIFIFLLVLYLGPLKGLERFGLLGLKKEKEQPSLAAGSCLSWAGQCIFVSSIDTMKLSKDMETSNLTSAQIDNAVALAAQQNTTHITVVTHYDYPDMMYSWVKSIRAHGKKVWFRAGIKGWGNGIIPPPQWLQNYQIFLQTYVGNPNYPNFFEKGDVFDPNAESENGYVVYCGCSLYGGTTWTTAFNQFLIDQTSVADQVFASKGFTQGTTNAARDILTTVHSVDPGTATGVLSQTFISAMDNLVTVDAYPDQNDTVPQTAANDWLNQLGKLHTAWPNANILIGEMGYSNVLNVSDSPQQAVIAAEMSAFSTTTYPLIGTNYWVGPGSSTAGGYTYIFTGSVSSGWTARPAAVCLSAFYNEKAGGTIPLCSNNTSSPTPIPTSKPIATPTPTPARTPTPMPTPTTPTPTTPGDTIPPTVSITSPTTNGSTVARKDLVTITANATDNVGVSRVEFYVNGTLTCTDTLVPYTCDWRIPAAPGKTYTLQAEAYDIAGNFTSSANVTVKSTR